MHVVVRMDKSTVDLIVEQVSEQLRLYRAHAKATQTRDEQSNRNRGHRTL